MSASRGASRPALLALFLLAAPLSAQLAAPLAPVLDYEPARAVLRRRGPKDARKSEELVASLAALGAQGVPELYELGVGRGLDAFIGAEWVPGDWLCEPEGIPPLAQQALERAPRAAVLAELATVLGGEPTTPELMIVLRLLGAQRSSGGLDLVLACATKLGDMEVLRPSVRLALRDALENILSVDPRAWPEVESALAGLEPAVCRVLVEAIGATQRSEGMRILKRLFGREEPPAELVAESMAELELERPWEFGGQTLERCNSWWNDSDPARRAQMARLAGRLGTAEHVPALVDLLAESDKMVKRCATLALESLAGGGSLPADEAGWDAWYEREQAWRETRWPALLETLTGEQAGPANEALRELSRHPLYRGEAAQALAGVLNELPLTVALAACLELERSASRRALPGLVNTLEGEAPQLRSAAWHALRVISGEQRELSVPLWRELVGS
ncbi:MAG: HEAT repeat domain-containing protein [Planctomycetes bacterium]|nr:HEAT repeat domain-containing protein [Planctomycetota bacterium]